MKKEEIKNMITEVKPHCIIRYDYTDKHYKIVFLQMIRNILRKKRNN